MQRAVRYSSLAIALHWTIAALITVQIGLGSRMGGPPTPEGFAVFQLHKSVGITILLLSLVRLAWRLIHPPPPEPPTLATWERQLSRLTHWAFYAVMIGMPLTGWIMVSTSRVAVPTLLWGVVPWPHLPGLPELGPAAKAAWNGAAEEGHHLLLYGAIGLFFLHVAGALKHQLFSRDEPILSRMAPGAVTGRWLEPRLLAIAAMVVGAAALGLLVQPPRPATTVRPEATVAVAPAAPPAAAVAPVAPIPAPTPEASLAATSEAPEAKARSAPVAWKVDRGSTLSFTTAWSGQAIEGRFDRWTADIRFSPDALKDSKVTVSVDVASAKTGDDQRDAALPSGDWFNADANPKATFTATRFTKAAEGRFIAHGRLTLRGVSRPLDLPFRLNITGDRAEVSGVTSLDRTAFGVGQGEWTSTDQIPAKVTVRISLKARRT